ncbi:MAG TPA: glycoside hydrolase family 32 protein [Bacteroidales bacterium]|nr:glycoside hydrolase family 32 protein [Bacteroidales bacterium]
MKKEMTIILVLLGLFMTAGCGDPNTGPESVDQQTIDTTTTLRTITESGNYSTFYKPQSGFVGDPMPYYNAADSSFYLYYLQDWRNGAPTDHPIYCTKTSDFGKFVGFTEAIPCGVPGSQEPLLGTGSFIKDANGKLYGFYTGHNGSLYPAEKILLATSTDMKTFTKVPGFALSAPDGYDKNNFRDPCVYYDTTRSCYVMSVTSIKDGKGIFVRYTSSDLVNWTLTNPLTEFNSDAQILECPDIFKMGNKWYLVFSRINRDEHRKTFYRISDSPNGPWLRCEDATGHHETFDGLYLYAAKTASDGTNRYISGWCSTGQQVNGSNELDWAGSLVTHQLVQQPDGRLYPRIPEAVDKKFSKPVAFAKLKSSGTVLGDKDAYDLTASTKRSYALFNRNVTPVKITMTLDAAQTNRFGFSFGAGGDLSELYSVTFDLTSSNRWGMPCLFLNKETSYVTGNYTKELNFTPLLVPDNKQFEVKIIIEKSICVVYVNDNVAFTNRIYRMNQNPWTIFVDNGTLHVNHLTVNKIP